MPAPIRVVVADDHPVFLGGLASALDDEDDIDLVGTATDGRSALTLARAHRPDVLVLDLEMPGLSGLDVARELQHEPPEVLILSAYREHAYIFGALACGAAGYLTKLEPLGTILDAVRGVANGETGWLSGRIADLVRAGRIARQREPHLLAPLSPREREVALEMARGHSNAEIADRLFISMSTVKKHVNAIFEKLDLPTRPRVVAWMWEHGLVQPDEQAPPP